MKKADISALSAEELLASFTRLSLLKGREIELAKTTEVNDFSLQIDKISDELKVRPGDQRLELRRFFEHPDIMVRIEAAASLLWVIPSEARAILQHAADSKDYPLSSHAGLVLSMYDLSLSRK